jgi:ribosomal protein L11 methyltransferase
MKTFLKIIVETSSSEEGEILIALLSDTQFYAFEQEENKLIAYINKVDYDDSVFNKIIGDRPFLSKELIEETNWNAQWESDFKPVRIGDFAVIRAAFHEVPKEVKYDLLITPKMSFGTGHHATTWLMVAQMEQISFRDKSVLDFGTGTGVLAILAEKLGASEVHAIDLDEWSIENTIENIHHNNCSKIEVEKRDNLEGLKAADIILANINLNVLDSASASISSLQKTNSLLLTSGFLKKDVRAIEDIFTDKNYRKVSQMEKDDWVAILFEKM